MRVLLINSNRARILLPVPPVGLSYVASATERAGHNVRFLDMMVSANPERELAEALAEFKPEVVGISVRNIDNLIPQRVHWQLGEVVEMIATIRKTLACTIVVGGPAITVLGASVLERLDADYALSGPGEETFPSLLDALDGKRPLEGIAGLSFKRDGVLVDGGIARIEKLGASGMERWLKWKEYERGGGTWSIQTKRGCPLSCSYCYYPLAEGHDLRARPATEVVDEIERIRDTIGPRTFEFTDPIFNVPARHAIEICEEIIRRKLDVTLSTGAINPMTVTEELFDLMKRAGFNSMVVSADSANDRMLESLGKTFTAAQVRRTARLAKASGIATTWFFIIGAPGETNESAEETIAFAEQELNWPGSLAVFMTGIRLLPGAPMLKALQDQGAVPRVVDLTKPLYYVSPELDEEWVIERISRAILTNPGIVHGAEESGSQAQQMLNLAMHYVGIRPPFWRMLPKFLRLPLFPALRSRYSGVKASSTNRGAAGTGCFCQNGQDHCDPPAS